MSGFSLKTTFNRLLKSQFTQYLKKTAIALTLASSVALPAAANHNNHDTLDTRNSGTQHSQELRSIQTAFNRAVQDRFIILMDRDWIELNRAMNDLQNDPDKRNRFLSEFLAKRGGLHINHDYFKSVTDEEMLSPHTQLISVTPAGTKQSVRACMIYGGRGVEDGETAVRNFIDVSRTLHGDVFADAGIKETVDARQWKQFVTYHEIGHCMDDFFVGKGDPAQDPDLFLANYHRAETFSDVYAVLIMARDQGVTDIGEKIANIRLAHAALSGPFQAKWLGPASISHYASYIYATHRPVRAAQDYINRNGTAGLQNMDYKQIATLARDIVNRNALSKPEADALMYLYASEFDMSVWDRLKDTTPFIAARYQHAVKLKAEMEQALRAVLDLKHIPKTISALEMLEFDATPAEYLKEARSKIDAAAMNKRAADLSRMLVSQAGGNNATVNSLIKTFTDHKDQWRNTLSNGTDAEKETARKNLQVAEKALWLAAHTVKGTAPQATNDNHAMPQINRLSVPHAH